MIVGICNYRQLRASAESTHVERDASGSRATIPLHSKSLQVFGWLFLRRLFSLKRFCLSTFFLQFFYISFFVLPGLITSASGSRQTRARGGRSAHVTRRHLARLTVLLAELGEESWKKSPTADILAQTPTSLYSTQIPASILIHSSIYWWLSTNLKSNILIRSSILAA